MDTNDDDLDTMPPRFRREHLAAALSFVLWALSVPPAVIVLSFWHEGNRNPTLLQHVASTIHTAYLILPAVAIVAGGKLAARRPWLGWPLIAWPILHMALWFGYVALLESTL